MGYTFQQNYYTSSLMIDFVLANSADPDGMLHYLA